LERSCYTLAQYARLVSGNTGKAITKFVANLMLSLVFYVPESDLEIVKEALFAAGAGRIGNYDRCCWQTKGNGQFRPLPGSNPTIGSHGSVERVEEWKVEMVCDESLVSAVVAALHAAHPYETPAYHVLRTLPL
jgi:hypothetical protein